MYCGKLLRTAASFPSQQLERARSVKSGDTGYMVIAVGAAAGFAQAVRRKNAQQLIWLSLVVLLYFMHGVLVAFDPARRIVGAAELGLSALLFCALLLHLRVAQKLSNPAVTNS